MNVIIFQGRSNRCASLQIKSLKVMGDGRMICRHGTAPICVSTAILHR